MKEQLESLKRRYHLEKDFIELENQIKNQKPKTILLQFPDGLKQHSLEIVEEIKKISKRTLKRESHVKIWLGSCFGSCDVPKSDSDLLVQFGHAPWNKNN